MQQQGESRDLLGIDADAARFQLAALKQRKIEILRNEMLQWYSPHSAQIDFHKSQARIRGVFGGNQSGKTLCGGVALSWAVGKVDPFRPNHKGPVFARDCCVDFSHVQQVLLPTYRKLLPPLPCRLPGQTFEGKERYWPGLLNGDFDKAYSAIDKVLHFADGGMIEFKSYDQGWQKFGGSQRQIIRMDEEPDESIFNENLARQTIYSTNMIITLTPLQYSQWLYNRIFEASAGSSDVAAFKMSSYDNPHANKEVLDKMAESITDPAERDARLFGEFTYLAGRVWKEYGNHNKFERFVNGRLTPPQDWECSLVIDPHPEKPAAVNWFAEDPTTHRLYIYREADLRGDVEQRCAEIKNLTGDEHISFMLMDPFAGKQRNSQDGRGQLIDKYRKYLPGIMLARGDKYGGIDTVAQLVKDRPGGPRLFVSVACPTTDHQLRNFSWKPRTQQNEDRAKPEVVKRDDDHCDCVIYRVNHRPIMRGESFAGFGIGVYANE